MIQLTDEEIEYEIKYVYEHNTLPIEVLLKPLIQSTNKAQLKKVHDWGNEDCPHNPKPIRLKVKRGCIACWQALLEEVK